MRCRICDAKEAEVLDPITKEKLCDECAVVIQETIGTDWSIDEMTQDLPDPYAFDYRDDDWTDDE